MFSPGRTQGPGGLLLRITRVVSEHVRQDEELPTNSQVAHDEWQSMGEMGWVHS